MSSSVAVGLRQTRTLASILSPWPFGLTQYFVTSPTVREMGYPNMELDGWNGLLAPTRTPAPVLALLQQEIAKAAQHPDVQRRLLEVGAQPVGSTQAELGALVREQMAKVRPLVTDL